MFLLGSICFLVYNEADRVYGLVNDDTSGVSVQCSDDNINSSGYKILAYFLIVTSAIIAGAVVVILVSLWGKFQGLRIAARPLKHMPVLLVVPAAALFFGSVVLIL